MRKNAFTILELLVVLAVIGVFSVVAYPKISNWIEDRNLEWDIRVLHEPSHLSILHTVDKKQLIQHLDTLNHSSKQYIQSILLNNS